MNKVYAVLYPIIWLFFGIFHPWRVVGNRKTPEGGVLLCGNHTTASDPIFVVMALGHRQQTRVLAKAELMRIPVLGWILKLAGIISVDRGKADVRAIKEAMKALKNGERLLLFPEGSRVEEGTEREAQTGAAMLATRTGAPILPIYIPRKKKWFRRTTLVFGEPYTPTFEGKKPTPEDYERISAELMERIGALKELAA